MTALGEKATLASATGVEPGAAPGSLGSGGSSGAITGPPPVADGAVVGCAPGCEWLPVAGLGCDDSPRVIGLLLCVPVRYSHQPTLPASASVSTAAGKSSHVRLRRLAPAPIAAAAGWAGTPTVVRIGVCIGVGKGKGKGKGSLGCGAKVDRVGNRWLGCIVPNPSKYGSNAVCTLSTCALDPGPIPRAWRNRVIDAVLCCGCTTSASSIACKNGAL